MKKLALLMAAVLMVLSFSACKNEIPEKPEEPEQPESSENSEQEKEEIPETTERKEVSSEGFENAAEIVLSEAGVTVDGKSAEESTCVTVGGEIIYYHDMDEYESGNPYGEGEEKDKHTEKEAAEHTLVTITEPGEYFIRGELKGQLAVDLGEEAKTDPKAKVTLIFGGADITCEIAPAVIFYNVYECADAEEEADETVDTSDAGANVIIVDGSRSNINGANVAKIFKDNGKEEKLHKYDAAFYSKMTININGGEKETGVLSISAKNEGLGSEMHLTFNGGIIAISSRDDGINTNEDGISVTTVNGGKITVKGGLGTEGDGIDSNGWLVINGGTLFASGNGRSGDGGIDADMGISINGGKVAAFGGRNDYVDMKSEQLFVRLDFIDTREAGSLVEFVDDSGSGIKETGDREFRSVVFSDAGFAEDKNYSLYVNGVLQEYTSEGGGIGQYFGIETGKEPSEGAVSNPYAVPEGFEEWLKNEKDIPEEIRKWIETMAETSKKITGKDFKGEPGKNGPDENETPAEQPENQNGGNPFFVLEESKEDLTVFVIERGKVYFSGIYDSPSATGKEQVSFTINGNNRIEDVFLGDIPEINSVECTEAVPSEQVRATLIYRGRDENISVSRSCLLSEGIEAIKELFRDLEPGDYRLTIAVIPENEDFGGSTAFNFEVVD